MHADKMTNAISILKKQISNVADNLFRAKFIIVITFYVCIVSLSNITLIS